MISLKKTIIISFSLCVLWSIPTFSQIEEIDALIDDSIAYMRGNGYKHLETIEGELNSEYGISFQHSNFVRGHGYKIISYYTKCVDCLPSIQLLENSKDTAEIFNLDLEFSDTPYRKGETSFFLQYQDKRGNLGVFSNSGKTFYVYSILFFK